MSKTKEQLKEEIELLRRRNASALEAEEFKAEAERLEKVLSDHGIPHPDSLISQLEAIENQYMESIMLLAKECEKHTGRPLIALLATGEELI